MLMTVAVLAELQVIVVGVISMAEAQARSELMGLGNLVQ